MAGGCEPPLQWLSGKRGMVPFNQAPINILKGNEHMDHRIQAFCEYLDHSHSAYHAQANLVEILKAQRFTPQEGPTLWDFAPHRA